jgi:hypothetical protein
MASKFGKHLLDNSMVMQCSGDRFSSAEKSLSQRAIDHLMGWRMLGLAQKERILPVGVTITAIGELVQCCAEPSNNVKGAIGGQNGTVLVLQVASCMPASLLSGR